jgi:hypothetical protein
MVQFAFVSRHTPTFSQHYLAAQQGVTLYHVGDADAFTVDAGFVHGHGPFEGVVVVHPAAALRLAPQFLVGVFENANRAPVGEKPRFEAVSFHIFDQRD